MHCQQWKYKVNLSILLKKNHIKGLHLRLPHELKRLESLIFIRTLILFQLRTLYWSDIKIHLECSRLLHLMST